MNLEVEATELELQELEAPNGTPSDEIYNKLLFVYLCQHDLCNAKLLWKRIPQEAKSRSSVLSSTWTLGQKLWNCEHSEVFSLLRNTTWPEYLNPYAARLFESYKSKVVDLIAKAYSSVHSQTFANLLGLGSSAEEAQAALSKLQQDSGWTIDAGAGLIIPKRPTPPPVAAVSNEEQLEKLTSFVSFLEN